MFNQKKKKQHYVWRRYLEAWCVNDKIACMRNNSRIFSTDLMNVGQQRYFYKVNSLTNDDIEFVKYLFIDDLPENIIPEYQRIFDLFSNVEFIETLSETDGISNLKNNYASNLEEEIQSAIESQGDSYLDQLLDGNTSFFNTEEGSAKFLNYICMQYCRTKKLQDSLINNISGYNKERIIKCKNLIRIIFSSRMALNLYCNRENYKLVLVDNETETGFLTCDQPVLNIFAIDVPKGKPIERFGFYYPISPRKAIFLVEKSYFNSQSSFQFNTQSVLHHNDMVVSQAHEQVYAQSEYLLQKYLIGNN